MYVGEPFRYVRWVKKEGKTECLPEPDEQVEGGFTEGEYIPGGYTEGEFFDGEYIPGEYEEGDTVMNIRVKDLSFSCQKNIDSFQERYRAFYKNREDLLPPVTLDKIRNKGVELLEVAEPILNVYEGLVYTLASLIVPYFFFYLLT
jgi:hypothetical protein